MKRIGIIGGMAPYSTASYYMEMLTKYENAQKNIRYPEIVIYSVNFEKIVKEDYKSHDYISYIFEQLDKVGCDCAIAACNSIHTVFNDLSSKMPIPWISIMEAVKYYISRMDVKNIGLLGTTYTMRDTFYDKYFAGSHEFIRPDEQLGEELNTRIYNEIVYDRCTAESKEFAVRIVENVRSKGADIILLACTELNVLFCDLDLDMPVVDSAKMHVDYMVEKLIESNSSI